MLISSGPAGAIPRPGPTSPKGETVGLKEYAVVVNGHSTTLQLSDTDAAAMGLTDDATTPGEKAAKAPENKSRTVRNKQA